MSLCRQTTPSEEDSHIKWKEHTQVGLYYVTLSSYVLFGTTNVTINFISAKFLAKILRHICESVAFHALAVRQFDKFRGNGVAHFANVADATRQAETSVEVQGFDTCNRSSHLEVAEE